MMIKISKVISVIFHPIFIALYCVSVMYITTDIAESYSVWGNITFWGLIILFTIAIPCLLIWLRYKHGKISDLELSERSQRTTVYLQTITSYLICAYLIFVVLQSYLFVLFFVFAIFSLAFLTVVNIWWKISIHSCGMGILCGFMVFVSLFYSVDTVWWLSTSILFSGVVMTARCILNAHTLGQVVAGFGAGLVFTLIPNIIFFVWF